MCHICNMLLCRMLWCDNYVAFADIFLWKKMKKNIYKLWISLFAGYNKPDSGRFSVAGGQLAEIDPGSQGWQWDIGDKVGR